MFDDLRKEITSGIPSKTETTTIEYAKEVKLKTGAPNIMRIINENDGYWFEESWIVCDDGTKRSFIVNNSHEGVGVLGKLIGDSKNFYRGGILETVKGDDGMKKDRWISIEDPEIMELVKWNGDRSNNSGSWKPSKKFIFNVIDRMSEDDGTNYCKVNKKSKVLKVGKKVVEGLSDTIDNNGPLNLYDINIIKKGTGKMGTDYSIARPTDPTKFPNVVLGEISDEEKSYEQWDLKKVSKLASATYVLKYLRSHISRVDKIMGTNTISDLEKQAVEEKLIWEKERPEQATPSVVQPQAQQPIVAQSEVIKSASPQVATPQVDAGEKLVPCDTCGAMISMHASVCDHCGQVYTEPA